MIFLHRPPGTTFFFIYVTYDTVSMDIARIEVLVYQNARGRVQLLSPGEWAMMIFGVPWLLVS